MSSTNDVCEESTSSSHEGEHMNSYTLKFKLDAVKYTELNSNRGAAKKFVIAKC